MSDYDTELSQLVAELNRAAPSQKTAAVGRPTTPQVTSSLDQLLRTAASRGASDLLLIAGAAATLEPEDVSSLVLPLLEPRQLEELQRNKSVDFSLVRENLGRFRI